MQQEKNKKQIDPLLSFHLMKFAFQDFQKSSGKLTEYEYKKAYQHAKEEMLLHRVILTSDEACCVVIPEAILNQTVNAVIAEYPSPEFFHKILHENNICLADYTVALHNDLRVETVLARIASSVEAVTPPEIQQYFDNNKAQFKQPERRNTGHIKITAKSSSSTETDKALQKITAIHSRVYRNPETFSKEAKQFSDSSTGTDGGKLGLLTSGELCHELDKVLFSLSAGAISPVIQSSSGFNILHCKKLYPSRDISFGEASSAIATILLKKKQLDTCRIWLQTLVQPI